jgi:type II secretory pathway component PulM
MKPTKKTTMASLALLSLLLMFTPASSRAREPHPEIRAALDSLRQARADLQNAARDYHGHRAAALQHVDEAIHEAEMCMHE